MREVRHGVNVEGGKDLLMSALIAKLGRVAVPRQSSPEASSCREARPPDRRFRRQLCVAVVSLVCLGLILARPGLAQGTGSISLIRDAEIEALLHDITDPILEAAGLSERSVELHIVRDDRLNAFVAGGLNLFMNTGMLMRTEHPGQLAGVIAHEVGHIAGGHLSRLGGARDRATAEVVLSTLLGAAAAVAGAPALGTAIIAGGQTVAQGDFLSFSRSQEQTADQAGVSYLRRIGVSSAGLAEFFHILDEQNLLSASRGNPYVRSHPLTRDRIRFVEGQVQPGEQDDRQFPAGWTEAHARMVAKLAAFLDDPQRVLPSATGDGLIDRYKRAIAYYRVPELEKAVAEVDRLIGDYPDDPYFHELKGQMLFENGRIDAAIAPYREAVRLEPVALLQIGLARALMESGDGDAGREAIDHLKAAIGSEPDNAGAWRLLGIAQGQAGQEGEASLSLAEAALLGGKSDDAKLYAKRAERSIGPNDPGWLQLQDILRAIEEG